MKEGALPSACLFEEINEGEISLGLARFLKTVKCRHRNGFLVIKIFIKPDPGLSLRNYHRRLKSTLTLTMEPYFDLTTVQSIERPWWIFRISTTIKPLWKQIKLVTSFDNG